MGIEAILDYVLVAIFFIAILAFAFYFARSPHPIDVGPEEVETVGQAPTQTANESAKNGHPVG
jgi:hypothetical protein